MKELLDTKKELANAGTKEVENLTRQLQQADFRASRGNSVERYPEKERIKLAAFEVKTAKSRQNKEKEKINKRQMQSVTMQTGFS